MSVDKSIGLYYEHMTIINDNSTIVNYGEKSFKDRSLVEAAESADADVGEVAVVERGPML